MTDKDTDETPTQQMDTVKLKVDGDEVAELKNVSFEFDEAKDVTALNEGLDPTKEYSVSVDTKMFSLTEPESKRQDGKTGMLSSFESDTPAATPDAATFTTRGMPLPPENVARSIYDTVLDKLEARRREGYDAESVVIGTEQYRALYQLVADDSGMTMTGPSSPDDLFTGVDLIAVPGQIIHPVIDNQAVLWEQLEQDD